MAKTPFKFWHEESRQWLYGGAAQNAFIKARGGWEQHHEDYALDVLAARQSFMALNQEANKTPLKRIK